MTWFRVDDQWLFKPEVQAAGVAGRALWLAVGSAHCAGSDTDGMIDPRVLPMIAACAGVELEPAAQALVDAGLWHSRSSIRRCGGCAEVARKHGGLKDGAFFHHAFLETNLDEAGKHDAIARARDLRRRRIRKDRELMARLRTRDRDECQYCGIVTRWEKTQDRRSRDLGEIDHVDPFGPDYDMSNLVVACKGCNADKKDRTPPQWAAAGGLLLRRPVDDTTDPTWVDHGSFTEPSVPDQDGSGVLSRDARDSGRVTDRAGSEPGTGPPDPGSDRVPGPGVLVETGAIT